MAKNNGLIGVKASFLVPKRRGEHNQNQGFGSTT